MVGMIHAPRISGCPHGMPKRPFRILEFVVDKTVDSDSSAGSRAQALCRLSFLPLTRPERA